MLIPFLKDLSIVLVADRTYENSEDADIEGNALEMISNEYFDEVINGLTGICKSVSHYQSPKELIDNIDNHKNDLVITIYGGKESRNRMALVPAVCEAYKVRFAGADVYARIVCQDKYLSKEFAKRYNIFSPRCVVVNGEIPKTFIEELKLPLVIKPNFEGSSIGINESSKVDSYKKAFELIEKLQTQFKQPILIEEFIYGREVCICVIGTQENITMFEVVEVYFEEDEGFLFDHLYTAKEKHLSDKTTCHRCITDLLEKDQKKNIQSLFRGLGKVDYMRLDGKINSDGFILIELTPDCYLGHNSAFVAAAAKNEINYEKLLQIIIHSALESCHIPYSSYKEN